MRKLRLRPVAAASAAVLAMGFLAACGGDSDNGGDSDSGSGDGEGTSVSIPIAAGWDEDIVITYLWKHVLEEEGYEVNVDEVEIGTAFAGVAQGDYDLFFDTWLPVTHEDYWNQYGDQIEDIGVWYDQATLNIAVPEYVDAETIGDLKGMEDEFGGQIIGIDPGAGLTRVTQEEAMPTYGLDGFDLKTSSTAAMLAEVERATDAEEPIVVTLWHPHWAYSAFPLKDLEDPEGAMGEAEDIHTIGSQDFVENNADIAETIGEFTMDDETLADLEKVALQDHDDAEEGVKAWIDDNQDFVDGMLG